MTTISLWFGAIDRLHIAEFTFWHNLLVRKDEESGSHYGYIELTQEDQAIKVYPFDDGRHEPFYPTMHSIILGFTECIRRGQPLEAEDATIDGIVADDLHELRTLGVCDMTLAAYEGLVAYTDHVLGHGLDAEALAMRSILWQESGLHLDAIDGFVRGTGNN